jgi:DNA-damage-inducible protein D
MKTELIHTLTDTFEANAQQTEGGVEYWLARDLQHLLGYTEWRNFTAVISKAQTACEVSGHAPGDHFVDVNKTIIMPKGAEKEVPDNRPLADFAPTIILKAKDFATEITIFNARENKLTSEKAISSEHITNNEAVRKTLLERGIRPEKLPPAEDLKKVERRLAAEEKKTLKNPDALDDF